MDQLSENKSYPKKIGLIEDDTVMRTYLDKLLRTQLGVVVVNTWEHAEAFWQSQQGGGLDILLVDLELPGQGGIELIQRMRVEHPRVICIVLTSSNNPEDVFSAIRGGASGYLIKQAGPEDLLRSLEGLVRDGLTLSPAIARLVADEFFRTDAALSVTTKRTLSFRRLTEREQQVLSAIAKRGTAKDTASELGLSYETVRVHMKKIYQKLHVKSKSEALALLAQNQGDAG